MYEDDPFECTFGLANPTYAVTKEEFCAQLVTTEFIAEVKKEIADATASNTSTQIEELEADLMIFGHTKGRIGRLKVSHSTSDISEKKLILELDEAFIDTEAVTGNTCSLRVTEYGDMRSFISSTSETNSYGESEDMVEYFDCSSGILVSETRTLDSLVIESTFVTSKFASLVGKGLLLKNINRDKTLAFGIFGSPDDLLKLDDASTDVTALC